MIKLENVNKYFNRRKRNEIHVINNTNLEFDDTGLVALLGPSGSGKTTLLNVIGGLDKVSSGKIYVNGKKITRKCSSYIDKVRNLSIGYVFQDYNLINDMSVYDNVALVLKMIGIKNKEEIKKRVNYVLEKTEMYRYRRRLAGMLSGGERQRVGIARAIVKNPSIIIADEPTGNLDSRNTIEIMNIIKSISKDRLVILVTHENELAYFYSNRIIELKDGSIISDKNNEKPEYLDYKIDNKIYLKDFKSHEEVKQDNININYYSDNRESLKIDVIVKNGNLYIKSYGKQKPEIINSESKIELINEHYKKIDKSVYEEYKFDFNNLIDTHIKTKYTSIFNPINLLINGFKKVFDYSIIKKLLLLGFSASGMFILFSISNIFGATNIKDEEFVDTNKNYLSLIQKKVTVEDYNKYNALEDINYILPGNSITSFRIQYDDFYQTTDAVDTLTGSLSSLNMISVDDVHMGKYPESDYEIVVDSMVVSRLFKNFIAPQAGIISESDLIGRKVSVNNMEAFTIVGLVNLGSPSIYANDDLLINIIANSSNDYYKEYGYSTITESPANFVDYNLVINSVELKKGSWPVNDYEVVINNSDSEIYKIGKYLDTTINGNKLKVVGYYHSKTSQNYLLVNNSMIKYNLINTKENLTIYAKDKNNTINYFRNNKVNIEDAYVVSRNKYLNERSNTITITLVVSGIILAISLIEIILMIRSSFLSRIKEVGILRAIGMKKKDIYKMFLGEILAITTIASVPGFMFMWYVIYNLRTISYFESQFMLTPFIILFGIIFIYIFNIVFGLIPVINTLKHTPAQILSRTDAD